MIDTFDQLWPRFHRIFVEALTFAIRDVSSRLMWSIPFLVCETLGLCLKYAAAGWGGAAHDLSLPARIAVYYSGLPLFVAIVRSIVLNEHQTASYFQLLRSKTVWRVFLANLKMALPLAACVIVFVVFLSVLANRTLAFALATPIGIFVLVRLFFVGVIPAIDGPISLKASWSATVGHFWVIAGLLLAATLLTALPVLAVQALAKNTGLSGSPLLALALLGIAFEVVWRFFGTILSAATMAVAFREVGPSSADPVFAG